MRDAAPTHQLRGGGGDSQAAHDGSGLEATFASHIDDALTWDCIAWLKSITTLPVLIKVVDGRACIMVSVNSTIVQ